MAINSRNTSLAVMRGRLTTKEETRALPVLFAPDARAAERFADFFTANIRNPNTRRAYFHAARAFAAWCEGRGLHALAYVKPVHIAAYIEGMTAAKPTVKQHLAALRMLFGVTTRFGKNLTLRP